MIGIILKNSVAIVLVLVIAYVSQLRLVGTSQTYYFPMLKKSTGYSTNFSVQGINDWLKTNVYDLIGGEVQKRQELVVEEIGKQKEAVTQNAIDSTKEFIAEKILATLGVKPEDLVDPAECSPQN